MKGEKAFCENCNAMVTCTVEEKMMQDDLKGKIYEFCGKEAICDICGHEVYTMEVDDYNLKMLYDEYRKDKDLISLEDIRKIPEMYDIGKRPLSILLGWGELTLTRYIDGDLPSPRYSDELKKIYNSPEYYLEILEKNKDNLDSEKTYEKSKKATEILIAERKASIKKIEAVSKYIIKRGGEITPLLLQKALYYIQGFYYAFYDRFVFDEDCEAWVHGPVYRNIYNTYSEYKGNCINEDLCDFDDSIFSQDEKSVFDSVIDNLCCYNGKVIEGFTHMETPWISARVGKKEEEHSDEIIEKEDIGKYFKQVKDKYNMINPGCIKDYSQDMFSKRKI